jgi:CRISPR-associated endoribonuclease Cas6
MRFKPTLASVTGRVLPINYQYEFSSWIYKTIQFGDPLYSEWLHRHGYKDGSKQFRLFTFSRLYPDKYGVRGDRLELQGTQNIIYISFYTEEAVDPFIIGLFENQEFSIGDKLSSVHFHVTSIEKLPEPDWSPNMKFSTETPLVISIKETETATTATYLPPDDERFGELFMKNLLAKYMAVLKQSPGESMSLTFGNIPERGFTLLGKPKSKVIRIKAGTPEETYLKGYLFDFSIAAPVELITLGYYAGFGEKNSLGFGYGSTIRQTLWKHTKGK